MTRNVAEAATGSTEIAQNIAGVAQAAQETTGGAARHRAGGRRAGPDGGRAAGARRAASATDRAGSGRAARPGSSCAPGCRYRNDSLLG